MCVYLYQAQVHRAVKEEKQFQAKVSCAYILQIRVLICDRMTLWLVRYCVCMFRDTVKLPKFKLKDPS